MSTRSARCTGEPTAPGQPGCGKTVPLMYGDGDPFRDRGGQWRVYIQQHGACGWRTARDDNEGAQHGKV